MTIVMAAAVRLEVCLLALSADLATDVLLVIHRLLILPGTIPGGIGYSNGIRLFPIRDRPISNPGDGCVVQTHL